jgi:hypothetical protein
VCAVLLQIWYVLQSILIAASVVVGGYILAHVWGIGGFAVSLMLAPAVGLATMAVSLRAWRAGRPFFRRS